ncbi:MAG: HD domain-containing protein [Candidatus Aenigmarchaeota archaeon]|nr:HD domain-containing protein [Candidatus Aenigmarchaeota archaeon]
MSEKKMLQLLFELGVLSRTPRTGPYHIGITNQETIAAHSFRSTALAYFIAQEEGADANHVLKMSLVHDFPETRLLNQTFVQGQYYSTKEKSNTALADQLRDLKGSAELQQAFAEWKKQETKESHVVHDANLLEALIEAKEYMQQGITIMERWFLDKKKDLKTKTGKKLYDCLAKEIIYWWKDE